MTVILAIALGLILGKVAGGSFHSLSGTKLRFELLMPAALLVQLLMPAVDGLGGAVLTLVKVVWVSSFAVLAAAALANSHYSGMAAIGTGAGLNGVAIALNGGMPVSFASALAARYPGSANDLFAGEVLHVALSDTTRVSLLTDIFPIAHPEWLQGVVSIGDVLLICGLLAFLVQAMGNEKGCVSSGLPEPMA